MRSRSDVCAPPSGLRTDIAGKPPAKGFPKEKVRKKLDTTPAKGFPKEKVRKKLDTTVTEACLECMALAGKDGGFLLSQGGGMASPEGSTPWDNIRSMVEAGKRWTEVAKKSSSQRETGV